MRWARLSHSCRPPGRSFEICGRTLCAGCGEARATFRDDDFAVGDRATAQLVLLGNDPPSTA